MTTEEDRKKKKAAITEFLKQQDVPYKEYAKLRNAVEAVTRRPTIAYLQEIEFHDDHLIIKAVPPTPTSSPAETEVIVQLKKRIDQRVIGEIPRHVRRKMRRICFIV